MTQPDQYLPDTATNSGSFAEYAAKPAEDYEAELKGQEDDRWGAGILDFMFPEGIPRGMPFPLALIVGITNIIIGAIEGIPIIGPAVGGLWDAISQIWNTADGANSAAANAASMNQATAAKLGALDVPGGVSITDGFAQAAGQLPDPPYDIAFALGGAGLYVANGDGLLVWQESGTADRACIYIHQTPIATDNGFISAVFEKRPTSGAQNYLMARYGASGHIRLQVENGLAGIVRFSTGGLTTLAATSIDLNKDVDVWELWFGTQADATALWVVRNGTRITALDCTDSVHTIDVDHRRCAVGGMAKANHPFGQRKPAELNSWTFADQMV